MRTLKFPVTKDLQTKKIKVKMTSLYQRSSRDDIEVFYTRHLPLPTEEDVEELTEISLNLLKEPYKSARSPLFALSSQTGSNNYPKLPKRTPSILLYSRNMYDIEYGVTNDFSIIHIHSDCEPLRDQAMEVTKSLRKLESVGIVSALGSVLSFYSIKYLLNVSKPVRNVLLVTTICCGLGVASFCSVRHWFIARGSFWGRSVDYLVQDCKVNQDKSELFLIKSDMADVSALSDEDTGSGLISRFAGLFNVGHRGLFLSLYTLTACGWITFIRTSK